MRLSSPEQAADTGVSPRRTRLKTLAQ